ncbi:MAG: hypothetical protein K2R93_10270 [Gemmatimonadaceae bacterium]|nr:hypothetical protein [Gemmatimonadaceae bacterium]
MDSRLLLHRILFDGLALSLVGSVIILSSLAANPRYWLQDYPKAIQDAVPKKTPAEKRAARLWGIPFMLTLMGGMVISGILLKRGMPDARFLTVYADTLGVALLFNTWDLLVLDWLIFCTITPSFLVIPGTAGMPGYKDYKHHVIAFITGAISSVVIAAIIAGLVYAFG